MQLIWEIKRCNQRYYRGGFWPLFSEDIPIAMKGSNMRDPEQCSGIRGFSNLRIAPMKKIQWEKKTALRANRGGCWTLYEDFFYGTEGVKGPHSIGQGTERYHDTGFRVLVGAR